MNNALHQSAWNQKVMEKPKYVRSSTIYKQMKAADVDDIYHYGIETAMDISNLISIILYADVAEIPVALNRTFREQYVCENLNSIKTRNREFANLSKILKETVNYFGQTGK